MKKYKEEREILTGIAQLLAETAIVNISSFSLREFIRKLAYLTNTQDNYLEYTETVLDSLLKMLKENSHREIFVFNGQSQSGVAVVPIRELPSDGYCFFGWIRVERKDQSYPSRHESPMCIFRLATKGEGEIKLYIHHGNLFYHVTPPESCKRSIGRGQQKKGERMHGAAADTSRTQGGHMVLPRALPPERRRPGQRGKLLCATE